MFCLPNNNGEDKRQKYREPNFYFFSSMEKKRPLTFVEEYRSKVFEKKVMRKIF